MAFVLDCSMTMAWVFPDEATAATDRLRDALVETRAFAHGIATLDGALRAAGQAAGAALLGIDQA